MEWWEGWLLRGWRLPPPEHRVVGGRGSRTESWHDTIETAKEAAAGVAGMVHEMVDARATASMNVALNTKSAVKAFEGLV